MSDDARLLRLSIHYSNSIRYGRRLEAALQRVVDEAQNGHLHPHTIISRMLDAAKAGLDTPKPPNPLANFYQNGFHTGHPYTEYLELPGTEYALPDDG